MLSRLLKIAFLLILFCAPCFANDWKKLGTTDGIERFSRPSKTSSVNEVMAKGIVKASQACIEAVLRDVSAETEYAFLCSEAFPVEYPGLKKTRDSFIIYNRTDMPFPVSDRDAYANICFTINPLTKAITARGKVLNSDVSRKSGVVRMTRGWNEFVLTPVSAEETMLEYTIAPDPSGSLPGILVNMLSKNMAANTIKKIRKLSTEEKYSKAKEILTTTIEQE